MIGAWQRDFSSGKTLPLFEHIILELFQISVSLEPNHLQNKNPLKSILLEWYWWNVLVPNPDNIKGSLASASMMQNDLNQPCGWIEIKIPTIVQFVPVHSTSLLTMLITNKPSRDLAAFRWDRFMNLEVYLTRRT